MPVKIYRPTSPGRRDMSVSTFETITRTKPERSLTEALKRRGGRNSQGRITVRHRGGGHKRRYRIIDFKRDRFGAPARVTSIEYDPNRSARIALLSYEDGEKRYIVAPLGVQVGDMLESGPNAEIRPGNALPIQNIPLGTQIHNIEMYPGRGAQLVRSAGVAAQLVAKEGAASAGTSSQRRGTLHRDGLPGDNWTGIEPGSQQYIHGQGRPPPLAGISAVGARRCDGSFIPSSRWWGGAVANRYARTQNSVGAAGAWQAHAAQQEKQVNILSGAAASVDSSEFAEVEEIRWDAA